MKEANRSQKERETNCTKNPRKSQKKQRPCEPKSPRPAAREISEGRFAIGAPLRNYTTEDTHRHPHGAAQEIGEAFTVTPPPWRGHGV